MMLSAIVNSEMEPPKQTNWICMMIRVFYDLSCEHFLVSFRLVKLVTASY